MGVRATERGKTVPQCRIKIHFSILLAATILGCSNSDSKPHEVPPGPQLPRDTAPEEEPPSPSPIPPPTIASIVEGVTTRDEILSWFGDPDATGDDRIVYKIWRLPNRGWRVGESPFRSHPQYAEWTPEQAEMKLLFDDEGVLVTKSLPIDW